MTIIYPGAVAGKQGEKASNGCLAYNVVAEDGTVGIRIPMMDFCTQLVHRLGRPLVSTSANISGEPTAQNYCDISQEIIDAVDYVCWTRRQEHKPHKPSSIIRLREDGQVEIIRK
jgi:L-threonylcarbamoyladenylate synthase